MRRVMTSGTDCKAACDVREAHDLVDRMPPECLPPFLDGMRSFAAPTRPDPLRRERRLLHALVDRMPNAAVVTVLPVVQSAVVEAERKEIGRKRQEERDPGAPVIIKMSSIRPDHTAQPARPVAPPHEIA
jgi:hypothetical protein